MDDERREELRTGYDRLAAKYVEHIYHELEGKPFDRELLDRMARSVEGLICDMGCGPGHVARYLSERGARVIGIDLSPGMIEQARQLNPGIEFAEGDMMALAAESDSLGGIVAFYSIIHIQRDEVVKALSEMKRALRPGGLLLVSFHIGAETHHVEELWEEKISIDFNFFEPSEMSGYLERAGFEIDEVIEREPYEGVEYPSRRAYIFAKKP